MGVRTYTTLERGPVVWIWMGDSETADPNRLPTQPWLTTGEWDISKGYMYLKASYVRLHENLLDLTHLSFLHAKSFGTPDYASAAYDTEIGDGHFAVMRNVVPTTLPPVWAEPTGIKGQGQAAGLCVQSFAAQACTKYRCLFTTAPFLKMCAKPSAFARLIYQHRKQPPPHITLWCMGAILRSKTKR